MSAFLHHAIIILLKCHITYNISYYATFTLYFLIFVDFFLINEIGKFEVFFCLSLLIFWNVLEHIQIKKFKNII